MTGITFAGFKAWSDIWVFLVAAFVFNYVNGRDEVMRS